MTKGVHFFCEIVSALSALVAAHYWYESATDVVVLDRKKWNGVGAIYEKDGVWYHQGQTSFVQSEWSRKAASYAAISALFQAIAIGLELFAG